MEIKKAKLRHNELSNKGWLNLTYQELCELEKLDKIIKEEE